MPEATGLWGGIQQHITDTAVNGTEELKTDLSWAHAGIFWVAWSMKYLQVSGSASLLGFHFLWLLSCVDLEKFLLNIKLSVSRSSVSKTAPLTVGAFIYQQVVSAAQITVFTIMQDKYTGTWKHLLCVTFHLACKHCKGKDLVIYHTVAPTVCSNYLERFRCSGTFGSANNLDVCGLRWELLPKCFIFHFVPPQWCSFLFAYWGYGPFCGLSRDMEINWLDDTRIPGGRANQGPFTASVYRLVSGQFVTVLLT